MKLVPLLLKICFLVHGRDCATSNNPQDVQFYLYADPARRFEVRLGDVNSLAPVRRRERTFIVIDGFRSTSASPMSQTSKNEILRNYPTANVFVLDWGKLSGSEETVRNPLETFRAYITVLRNVGPVAQTLARFLGFLRQERNIEFSQVHIIGHSLGAHLAGATGYWVSRNSGGLLGRITGLDPAGPFFSQQPNLDKRLHKGDAAYVDIYHTNRGTLGDSALQTGDINVFVNGGAAQPGCEKDDNSGFSGLCSHSYSWMVWNHCSATQCYACPCTGYNCQCASCNPSCSNGIYLGLNSSPRARGVFYLRSGPLRSVIRTRG